MDYLADIAYITFSRAFEGDTFCWIRGIHTVHVHPYILFSIWIEVRPKISKIKIKEKENWYVISWIIRVLLIMNAAHSISISYIKQQWNVSSSLIPSNKQTVWRLLFQYPVMDSIYFQFLVQMWREWYIWTYGLGWITCAPNDINELFY